MLLLNLPKHKELPSITGSRLSCLDVPLHRARARAITTVVCFFFYVCPPCCEYSWDGLEGGRKEGWVYTHRDKKKNHKKKKKKEKRKATTANAQCMSARTMLASSTGT